MNTYKINLEKPVQFVRGGKFSSDKGWIHDTRIPTDYEVIIGLKGSLYLTIGTELVTIKTNDICIIPPNIVHKGSKSLTEHTSFFWLHFLVDESKKNSNNIAIPMFCHFDNTDEIILQTKFLLDKSMSNASTLNLNYVMSLVLLEIDNKIHSKHQLCNNLIIQVEEYIRVNIYANLTVKDIANHFNYSPDYISNIFRKYYGYSLKKYLVKQELNEIKKFLLTTDLSIKELAIKFNFNDEKYLMRLFKNNENITITNYRNSFVKVKLNNHFVKE